MKKITFIYIAFANLLTVTIAQKIKYENGFKVIGPIEAVLVGPLVPVSDKVVDPYFFEKERNDMEQHHLPSAIPLENETNIDQALQDEYSADRTPSFNEVFNVGGFTPAGAVPPDPISACGDLQFVVAINGGAGCSYRVYDKITGVQIGTTLGFQNTFNLSGGSLGDPVVVYDDMADRWVLAEISDLGNFINIYVSLTNNIVTTSWYGYQVGTIGFDYPKLSVWPSAYLMTLNDGPNAYVLDRNQMLVGGATTIISRPVSPLSGFGFQSLTPVDFDGINPPPVNAPCLFMRHRDTEAHGPPGHPAEDYLEMYEFTPNFASPGSSVWTSSPYQISVAEFSSNLVDLGTWDVFAQPGTTQKLFSGRETIMHRPQYINFGGYQSIVACQVTDANGADRGGIRWYELRKPGATWTVYQQGTYAPASDNYNRWMPAISQDINANIAICYSVVSTTIYPGLRMTARSSSDPLGQMTQPEYNIVSGLSSQTTINRWGDYFSMTQDPVDWKTFYFDGEYMNSGGNWKVRNFAFNFATNLLDLKMVTVEDLTVPVCDDTTKTIDAIFKNGGVNTLTSASINYVLNGGSVVTIPYVGSLGPGSYDTISILLSPINVGSNSLVIYTSSPNGGVDEDFTNDTLTFNIIASSGLSGTATQVQNILCWNQNNGQISISASGGLPPYTYSIGGSYGGSSSYTNIGPGILTSYVKDAAGCIYACLPPITFTNPPNIVATATIIPASSGAATDGSITINATGGTGALQYNLNGGSFQSSNLFSNIGFGTYSISVQDTNGCSITFVVSVGALGVDVNPLVNSLRVYPNPTFGKVTIHYLSSLVAPNSILEVFNQLGQAIKTVNCGDLISGQNIEVDITGNARGVYTFRLTTGKWSTELKVMLQ